MGSSEITLQDVAERAGLSLATASRVLNGGKRVVAAASTARILQAAEELGYVSNGPAQALARSTTAVVGLIVHEVDDPYFATIAKGAMRVASVNGLLTTLANTFGDHDLEVDYVQRLQAQRVRALLLAGSPRQADDQQGRLNSALERFIRGGGRVAVVGDHRGPYSAVLPANRRGAAQVARHLFDLRHRRVGIISGPPHLTTVHERLAGFADAWAELGGTPGDIAVVDADFSRDGGYSAMIQLAEQAPEASAVFALNDLMAIGALAALHDDLGRDVPGDVSVVGFDDLWMTVDLRVPLTTVRLPLEAMGTRAMEMLVGADATVGPQQARMPADLIVRASTGPAPMSS